MSEHREIMHALAYSFTLELHNNQQVDEVWTLPFGTFCLLYDPFLTGDRGREGRGTGREREIEKEKGTVAWFFSSFESTHVRLTANFR